MYRKAQFFAITGVIIFIMLLMIKASIPKKDIVYLTYYEEVFNIFKNVKKEYESLFIKLNVSQIMNLTDFVRNNLAKQNYNFSAIILDIHINKSGNSYLFVSNHLQHNDTFNITLSLNPWRIDGQNSKNVLIFLQDKENNVTSFVISSTPGNAMLNLTLKINDDDLLRNQALVFNTSINNNAKVICVYLRIESNTQLINDFICKAFESFYT